MDQRDLQRLFEQVQKRQISVAQAAARLKCLPFENIGFAHIDHHRALRQGFAEVVYGQGKTPQQVAGIVRGLLRLRSRQNILITRANSGIYRVVRRMSRRAKFHVLSRAISIRRNRELSGKGTILVVAAGTSDISVAEEAVVTAEVMGNRVDTIYDVGVAGLQRLLGYLKEFHAARVIVCVAGMEGALPSVIAGLVGVPVIAVPTSVGYGSNYGGLAALLTMLNSCASNISVVNIDNGFGGGYVASLINRL